MHQSNFNPFAIDATFEYHFEKFSFLKIFANVYEKNNYCSERVKEHLKASVQKVGYCKNSFSNRPATRNIWRKHEEMVRQLSCTITCKKNVTPKGVRLSESLQLTTALCNEI